MVPATEPLYSSDMAVAPVVLDVRGLSVAFPSGQGFVRPVRDVSLSVRRGQRLGIVGESGSGKSLTALALMGLVPPRARIAGGSVLLRGLDLARVSERE